MSKFISFVAATALTAVSFLLAVGVPLSNAHAEEAAPVQVISVSLTSFKFSPRQLRLTSGKPILVRVSNDSGMAHDFSAPEFFAASELLPASTPIVRNGKISLAGHESVSVGLVPTSGRYSMKCTHAFHKQLGMSGTIVVQ